MAEEIKTKKKGIRRRKFLKYSGLGIGLMIGGVYLTRHMWRRAIFEMGETAMPAYDGETGQPMVWFQVTPDNKIKLLSPKVEMGQGTFTSLAQMAADELEVDMDKIEVVHAPTDSGNIDPVSTGGSLSVASLWQPLREMAATLREMLKTKAAEKLGIAVSALSLANGVITGGGKSMTYGEVVEGVTDWKIPDVPPLKDRKDHKYIGKPIPRIDLHDKVVGAPIFGMDATMPDMLYGSVVRSRLIDTDMSNFDTSEAEKMPGVVKVVKADGFVGVVARSFTEADNARRKIKFDYNIKKDWNLSDVEEAIKVGNGSKTVIQKEGKAVDDIDGESETLEIQFRSPIGAHAQIEPNGALASYEDGKVTLMLSTQVVGITRTEVAKALGIDAEDVNVIPTYLGGGFGRRLHTPNAIQAAVMSKAVGKPVKCFFDRKQEFQNDTFRPPTHHIMRGKLSADGKIVALEHNFASGDTAFNSAILPAPSPVIESVLGADVGAIRGGAIMYKGIENHRATYYHVDLPFATSFWRSLGLLANAFAIESFMDELAIKADKNPVDFRLDYLPDDGAYGTRTRNVIKACAEKAGYKDKPSGDRAMGFAASIDAGSPCAQVVEVSIVDNEIKVHKVTAVLDCGIAVNPDQVRAQVEGCICMGISASLFEKMDLRNNKLYPTIYGPYQMALMKDSPKEIETILIEGADIPLPVGEPPLGPIGAAIGNAVRRLTGKRLTELPMKLA